MGPLVPASRLHRLLGGKEVELIEAHVGIAVIVHVEVVLQIEAVLRFGREDGERKLVEELHSLKFCHLALQADVVAEVVPSLVRLRAGGVVAARVPPEG